jgi:D-aspartate ligase
MAVEQVTVVDTTVPVVVLTASPAFLLHGVMGIVRTLGRLDLAVYVVHDDRWAPPDSSRYLAGKFTSNFDDAAPDGFLEDLLDVGRKIGRHSVLIPVDDVTALFVDDHAEPLKAWFMFPDQPAGLARSPSSKQELGLLCQRLGIPTPEMAVPQSRGDAAAFAEQAQFPVVVKAIDPMLLRQRVGARSVVIVDSPDALLEAYETMNVDGTPNSPLQEYIPGGPESIWMFNGYFDNRSECLFGFTGTKLRQYPPYTGPACLAVRRRNPPLEQATKAFLKTIGYRGIVDLGYRYDSREGDYKLLDVNPRIGPRSGSSPPPTVRMSPVPCTWTSPDSPCRGRWLLTAASGSWSIMTCSPAASIAETASSPSKNGSGRSGASGSRHGSPGTTQRPSQPCAGGPRSSLFSARASARPPART